MPALGSDSAGLAITSAIGADKPKVSFTDTLKTAIDSVNNQIAVASGAAASYAAGNHALPLSSVMVACAPSTLV